MSLPFSPFSQNILLPVVTILSILSTFKRHAFSIMSPNRLSPTFLQHSRTTKTPTKPSSDAQQPFTTPSHAMDNSSDNQLHVVPEETLGTPEPESPPAPAPETDPAPEVPPSPESSVTAPSTSSTEPSETSETPRGDGPLSSLAQKAADTQLGRAASEKIPQSARPTLHRASRVLNTVDEHLLAAKGTLDTDEGRRVVKSGCEFASSLIAFAAMLFTVGVSSMEKRLGIHPAEESTPKRFIKLCREATTRATSCAETREKQVEGSCEARIYAHARHAMHIVFSVFKSCLKGMSEFKGPGGEYVTPVADKIISILPEDIQLAVRQSQGPLMTLRKGLGLDSETCSASQDSPSNATHETPHENSRVKVE